MHYRKHGIWLSVGRTSVLTRVWGLSAHKWRHKLSCTRSTQALRSLRSLAALPSERLAAGRAYLTRTGVGTSRPAQGVEKRKSITLSTHVTRTRPCSRVPQQLAGWVRCCRQHKDAPLTPRIYAVRPISTPSHTVLHSVIQTVLHTVH